MKANSSPNYELLEFFLDFLRDKTRKSSASINSIKRDLESFLEYLDKEKLDLDRDSIKIYADFLEKNYTNSTYKLKLSSMRQFAKWLDLGDLNLSVKILKSPKSSTEELSEYYSKEEIKDFLDRIENPIERLALNLIFELNLSSSELLSLKISDFNFANSSLLLRGTELKVATELAFKLKEFIRDRDDINLNSKVFSADLLNEQQINKIFREQQIKPKIFKQTRVIQLLQDGSSLHEVETKLGLKLKAGYLNFSQELKDYKLLKAFKEFHPRASSK